MHRIYYYPNTGAIKYQINIELASQYEPMPFVDFVEHQDIEGKKIDLVSKTLVPGDPIVKAEPTFAKPERIRVRDFNLNK
jgi:hypothetical protein